MAKLNVLATMLVATSVLGAPAMAREIHRSHRLAVDTTQSGAIYLDGRACIPAPRVGSFATAPWGNGNIPCEPSGYGHYGHEGGYTSSY